MKVVKVAKPILMVTVSPLVYWKGLVEKAYREAAAKAPGDMRGRKRQSAKDRTLDPETIAEVERPCWRSGKNRTQYLNHDGNSTAWSMQVSTVGAMCS